jgi:hypothetical protein
MKTIREGDVVVLPRDDKTVDIFTGQGWDRHTVFEVSEGKIRFVKGVALSQEQFKKFKSCL